MAPRAETNKRKASTAAPDAEKMKKVKKTVVEAAEAPAKKRKAVDDAAPVKIKKSKASKSDSAVSKPKTEKPTEKPTETKIIKKSKKHVIPKAVDVEKEDLATEDDEDDVDDQTEALLKGFESDGDDEDALNEEGLPEGAAIPVRKELSKKEEKKLKKIAESGASDKPGVIYLGRIPHGFYENEMKQYFRQFGNILKIRLSRNKRTGASRHYAWIQFESATVAEIVARTMNNYLMFGHLLKVRLVPDEAVHEELFKGANKRFKKVPWNKMEGRKLEQGVTEEKWDQRIDREKQRRVEKAAKLKAIGYEFEAPPVKSAKGVAKDKDVSINSAGDAEEPKSVGAAPSRGTAEEVSELVEESSEKPAKKQKKSKKRKAAA